MMLRATAAGLLPTTAKRCCVAVVSPAFDRKICTTLEATIATAISTAWSLVGSYFHRFIFQDFRHQLVDMMLVSTQRSQYPDFW